MLSIKRLGLDEFEGFLSLLKGFYSYSGDGAATAEMVRPLFEKATDPKSNFYVFVASNEDKLIGMVSLTIGESSYKVASFGWADDFFVEEAFRSQGVGRKLMLTAAEFAKNLGCSNILVGVGQNETETLKFYEKNGFKDMHCKLMTLPL